MEVSGGWIRRKLSSPTLAPTGPRTLQTFGTADKSSQVRLWSDICPITLPQVVFELCGWAQALFQEITRASGKRPTASRGWATSARWRVARTPSPPLLQVRLITTARTSFCCKCLRVTDAMAVLQTPTATRGTCCTKTTAISLRQRWPNHGKMRRSTAKASRDTWPASTRRRSSASSPVRGRCTFQGARQCLVSSLRSLNFSCWAPVQQLSWISYTKNINKKQTKIQTLAPK